MKYHRHFVFLFLFISVCSYLLYTSYQEVEKEQIGQLNNEQIVHAKQAAKNINTYFKSYNRHLVYLAGKDDIYTMKAQGGDRLNDFYNSHFNEIKAVTRVDSLGRIIYTVPFDSKLIGKNISGQKHVTQFLKTHKPLLSNVFNAVQGYRSIAYYVPVIKDNVFNGGLAILLPFDSLTKASIDEVGTLKNKYVMIINQEGKVLFSSVNQFGSKSAFEIFNSSHSAISMLNKALNGDTGTAVCEFDILRNGSGRKEWYSVYYPIKVNNEVWSIIIATSKDEVLKSMRGLFVKWVAIFLLLSIGSIIFLYYTVKARAVVKEEETRQEAEKAMIRAKERAEKSEKLKSEFLAQMSHEIRSPINSILSFSSLLKDELHESVSPDLRISFSAIENAGSRIIRTIDLILNMSEIQTGGYEPLFRHINLTREVLDKLCLEFRHVAEEKGLALSFVNKSALKDPCVYADEYTITQIFNNLINNAVKYTEKGRIEISLSVSETRTLVVEVSDTGIGISKEYLPDLFSPFSQEEQGYTRRYEGNGLGLALVKKYCEINNLVIEVESEKHKGSIFRVIFREFNEQKLN